MRVSLEDGWDDPEIMYEKVHRMYFLRISIFKRQSGEKKTWKAFLDTEVQPEENQSKTKFLYPYKNSHDEGYVKRWIHVYE